MRFVPLEVEIGSVVVILWTGKVIEQIVKINETIDFLSKNHWFLSQKCPQARFLSGNLIWKINCASPSFLSGRKLPD